MSHDFDKYWNCLKKHRKRAEHWLPCARELSRLVGDSRAFRYFTLCARPMVDVFMLARDGVLAHDGSYGAISDVVFCEINQEHYPEITEMVGVEGAGFLNRLETLVLFEDTVYSAQFPTLKSIDLELEIEGLQTELRELLLLKRQHLEFSEKFPFDFLNLDFCDYYYEPPGIFRINKTIDKLVELQRRQGEDVKGHPISVNEFALAVTCKFDSNIPSEAFTRLQNLVRENQDQHKSYLDAVQESRGTTQPDVWRKKDDFDFFLSSWPKEIIRTAHNHGWQLEIQDYVHYGRVGDRNNPYQIVSIVCRFRRAASTARYLSESIRMLNKESRLFIDEVDRVSAVGRDLLADLEEIVAVRNERAKRIGRIELPAP
jgi:hypothetical protein